MNNEQLAINTIKKATSSALGNLRSLNMRAKKGQISNEQLSKRALYELNGLKSIEWCLKYLSESEKPTINNFYKAVLTAEKYANL